MKVCSSCNKQVVSDFIEFPNPGNLKTKIVRCAHCRESAKTYTAPGASFVGP